MEGATLIAVICGLIFIEEVGVPLPFAPGDIVLALGGIAIAGDRVNAMALIAALAVAVVGGAMLGREIFAWLGWERLMRVAEPLHARGPLERAAAMLRRGGWRAVFTARLVPGLRVYTTQVAGVSSVSRLTFLAGLKLPLFLDSIGTVLAGVVAGPWVGGSVGFISNLISSNTIDPIAAPYALVSFAVGFAAGLSRYLGWHRRLSGWIALWLLC